MPLQSRLISPKYYAQLNNGDDFQFNKANDLADAFKANIVEKVRAVLTIEVGVDTQLTNWQWIYNTSVGTAEIRKSGFDFTQDYAIGDSVYLWFANSGSPLSITATILSVVVGEIKIGSIVGSAPPSGSGLFQGIDWLTNTTPFEALEFSYNLIPNGSDTTFLNPYTNAEQVFAVDGLPASPNPTPVTDYIAKGINKAANNTTILSIEYKSDVDNLNPADSNLTWKQYEIIHDFVVDQFWFEGEEDNLEDSGNPPDIFSGDESLKYIFQTKLFSSLTNPNTAKTAVFDKELGSVGYQGESFNGFLSPYSVSNLRYTDADTETEDYDQIQASQVTRVTCSLLDSGNNFQNTDYLVVTHSKCPTAQQYSNSSNDWFTVWGFESLRKQINASDENGIIITNFATTFISAGQIDVKFDIQYTPAQLSLIESGDNYGIWFTSQNFNVSEPKVDNGNKSTTKIDFNQYAKSADIKNLHGVSRLEHYPHPEDYVSYTDSVGATNVKTDVEEGIFTMCEFWLDNAKRAVLQDLFFKFVAYNPTDGTFFTLREVLIDLSDGVVIDQNDEINQKLNLDDTRGYLLRDDNQFNFLKLYTTDKVSDKQFYILEIGWKVPWQEWEELSSANPIFYNNSQDNNGLNNFSRNYSSQNDLPEGGSNPYELRVMIEANVTQDGVATTYRTRSEDVEVYGYDEDDQGNPPTYTTCEIKTYDENDNELAGRILEGEGTKIIFTAEPETLPSFSENIDFTNVPTNYDRFAHGNKYTNPLTMNEVRRTVWADQQANDTDEFRNSGGTDDKKGDPIYNSTTNSITTTANSTAFYGCMSPDNEKFENYSITGKMFSTNADDDAICYIIAFNIDGFGVEHTLALCVTTGGVDFETNPSYVSGDDETDIFDFKSSVKIAPKYSLVYDFGKEGAKILTEFSTGEPDYNWNTGNDFEFEVIRELNSITINPSWLVNGTTYTNQLIYDLTSDADTNKFLGAQRIGFGFCSQNDGGFKDVVITKPSADNYAIIRAEAELSPSDSGISEISTIENREAPKNNLLLQNSGDLIISDFSFVDGKFFTTCKVNQDQVVKGQKYKLSAEIGSNNLFNASMKTTFAWVDLNNTSQLHVAFNCTPLITDVTGLTLNFTEGTPRTLSAWVAINGNVISFVLDDNVSEGDVFTFDYDGTNNITCVLGSLAAGSINVLVS